MLALAYILTGILLFFLGACIASFLNVVAYRLPRKLSFVKGRSFCPACGHTLGAGDLVPVVSYLALLGKCRYCKARIPARYLLRETLGGVASVLCYLRFGFPLYAFAFAVAMVLLLVAFIDWDTKEIPDSLHIMLGVLGIAAIFLFPDTSLVTRLIGIIAISVPMLLLSLLIAGAFGGGDIKLMAAAGLLLGWKLILLAFLAALLFGGIYAIVLLGRKKAEGKTAFAFGPFLCLGIFLAMLYGEQIIGWYLSLF